MRYLLILAFLCISAISGLHAQSRNSLQYIQVNAVADALGNINVSNFEFDTSLADSLKQEVIKTRSSWIGKPILKVINILARSGWTLVTSVYVASDKNGNPNSPFIAYYFSKN